MKKFCLILSMFPFIAAYSQQDAGADSVSTMLDEVVVEARNQRLGAELSTYIPTSRQKNASQTAFDLLDRMAIPQLRILPDNGITNQSGKSVDVFIDFMPASKEDLEGMRMQDVKRVEYYDFPSDPRFQGKAYVVNFVMQKYEYGGYVKAYGWENTGNAGQVSLYGKLQYKRMTFDIAAGVFYLNQKHTGGDTYETFRLPQPDGTVDVLERNSCQSSGKLRKRSCWPTFKALYSSDKIMVRNVIGASFDHTPANNRSGHVGLYAPEGSSGTGFSECTSGRINSFSYNGYWNFILDDANSISFEPEYSYSHTNTDSFYKEGSAGYYNAAKDDSHEFMGNLSYAHSFGKWGNLNVMLHGVITTNSTSYAGTANTSDRIRVCRVAPGVRYSLAKGKFYGLAGLGVHWNSQEYLDYNDDYVAPWMDFSLQYSPDDRHSVRGEFHYKQSVPSSNLRSSAIIQSNPLMSYTGNPGLVSYGNYDAGMNYSYIPGNGFSMSAFASAWIVDNRCVYDYEPSETGILRTVRQPGGGYWQWNYGAYATLRLFDRKLRISAQISAVSVRNGEPYNLNKTHVAYAFQANYYLGNWTFSGIYYSPQGSPEGCMSGTWIKNKSYCMIQAGWSDSTWNLQLQFANFARLNWRSDTSVMRSRYYDKAEQTYSINDHALARLAVTYTFGFGKKVQRGDEASQQSGVNSGILK